MATPSGIALFQFRDSEGVLISEASAPAPPRRSARDGSSPRSGDSVNTAVAFAPNPASRPVDNLLLPHRHGGDPNRGGKLHAGGGTSTWRGSCTRRRSRSPGVVGDLHLPGFGAAGGDRAAGGPPTRAGEWLGTTAAGDAAAAGASLAAPERLDGSAGVPALRRRAGLGHPGDPGQPHPAADHGNAGVFGTGRRPR